MHPKQFRKFIVKPVLEMIPGSPAVEELMMMTWATESMGGQVVKQGAKTLYDGGGVALGVFQHEPATYRDDWANFIHYRPNIFQILNNLSSVKSSFNAPPPSELIGNLPFATAMCRVHYLRFNEPVPPREAYTAWDAWITGLACYYKRYWNTEAGKATVGKAVADYVDFVQNVEGKNHGF